MFRISLLIMMSIAALCNASCDYPWVQIEPSSKCYLMSLEIMSWYEADMVCKENGGILAEPRTAEETELLNHFCQEGSYYWIGLSDLVEEGTFQWASDYSEPDYTDWYSTEPNGDGDCVFKHTTVCNLQWFDANCDVEKHALCQKDP